MNICSKEGCNKTILMDGFCVRHLKQRCSICLEDISSINTKNNKRLTCGHAFHTKCIVKWFVTSDVCPSCRTPQTNDVFIFYKKMVEEELRKKYKEAIRSLESENRRLMRGSS